MNIRDATLIAPILVRHGRPEGHVIDCHGTLVDREDFIYFTVYPGHLQVAMHRILADVAAFDFHFVLRPDGERVVVERIVRCVEGANGRIRAALGEAYAKTSIGVPFEDLSEEEEAWIAIALKTFYRFWMQEPA